MCESVETDPLIGGTPVTPEDRIRAIGALLLGGVPACTATLVAPDVIITAAHCVALKTCAEPACSLDAAFEIDGRVVPVVASRSFLGRVVPGAHVDVFRSDIALLRLETAIDDQPPLPLARRWPNPGARLEHYGMGCSDRCGRDGPTSLQRVSTVFGQASSVSCQGDSGGPILDDAGQIVRITSGYRTKTGDDFHGDVVSHANALEAQLIAWRDTPVPRTDAIPCSEATSCESCAAQRGCGFCRARNTCLDGREHGPFDTEACEPEGWVWNTSECGTAAPLPPVARVTPGDCSVATDCATCARLAGCGWSDELGGCLRGSQSGPSDGRTPFGWVFVASCCPAPSDPSRCGDASCDPRETCASCADDCGPCPPRCGDGRCELEENCTTCLEDCLERCRECEGSCGDGRCQVGETCESCETDCACSDACGDSFCRDGETCESCPADCPCGPRCGDGSCDGELEDCRSCPADCGSCAGRCGDLVCSLGLTESCESCADDCGACTGGAPIVRLEWRQEADVYTFTILAPEPADMVELAIDGFVVGRPRRRTSEPPVFTVTARIVERREARVITARAFDAAGVQIATGDGQMDTTTTAGVWVRRQGDRTYDIGLERVSSEVRSILVEADGFVLMDEISSTPRSDRGWIRYTFSVPGSRALAVRTFDSSGAMRGVLRRTLTVR